MHIVYRFDDGQEFDDIEKAREYEKKLKEEQIAKEKQKQKEKVLYDIVQTRVDELNKAIKEYETETGDFINLFNNGMSLRVSDISENNHINQLKRSIFKA